MSINATLIAQIIVFVLLVWFTMEFVWPLLLKAMEEREKRIADGLAAGEKGRRDLEEAERRSHELIDEGKRKASELIAQAQQRSDEIVEEAKQAARSETERLLAAAQIDAEREKAQAREQLRAEVAALAVTGAERILQREVDVKVHAQLLEKLGTELAA